MDIYNLNTSVSPWTAWHYSLVEPIHSKINSLYDYMYYFQPEYVILNSAQDSTSQQEFSNVNEKFFKTIKIKEKDFICCFIAKLNYHEGLLNLNSTNAFCVYEKEGVDNNYYIYNSDFYFHSDDLETWYLYKAGKEITDTSVINNLKGNFFVSNICFCNIQPHGVNNKFNPEKFLWSNFLFFPLGNPGFYSIFQNSNDWLCNLIKPDDVAEMMISLASDNTRLCVEDQWKVGQKTWSISNYSKTGQNFDFHIVDKNENLWTGSPKIMHEEKMQKEISKTNIYYETIYIDNRSSINQEKQGNAITHRYSLYAANIINLENVGIFLY